MAKILVFKPGAIGYAEKQALLAAGIVPIETADPDGVRLLEPEGESLAGGDLLYAALAGLQRSDYAKQTFADTVLDLVRASRAKLKSSPMPARDVKGRFLKPKDAAHAQ